jgi:hypothetical protein
MRRAGALQLVRRTPDAQCPTLQYVRINHRRRNIGVAQRFLNGPDVIAVLEQVRGERMPAVPDAA